MSTKKYLFEKVFEKAKRECGNQSKNGMSVYLEKIISDDYNYSITSKSFSRHYNDFVKGDNLEKEINPALLNILAEYLGHENFADFNQQFDKIENDLQPIIISEEEDAILVDEPYQLEKIVEKPFIEDKLPKKKSFFEAIKNQNIKYFTGGGIATALVAGSLLLNNPNTDNTCMVWKENHYEEIECNETNPQMNAIPYNEDISQLQKITRTDTLNLDNAIGNVWYNKSNGKVDFFTNYGLHPENGKTLKPVTEYMLKKYAIKK